MATTTRAMIDPTLTENYLAVVHNAAVRACRQAEPVSEPRHGRECRCDRCLMRRRANARIRAAEYESAGIVARRVAPNAPRWTVPSASRERIYIVDLLASGQLSCACEAGRANWPCWHVAAVLLDTLIGTQVRPHLPRSSSSAADDQRDLFNR